MSAVLPLPRSTRQSPAGAGDGAQPGATARGNVVHLAASREVSARLASVAAKVVLLGPMGAGKSRAIRSVSDDAPVATDVPSSLCGGPSMTTVGLDFSGVTVDGTRLLLFGVPGQSHFDFMWPLLLRGAAGVVVMLDARDPDLVASCDAWIGTAAAGAPQAARVVGVGHVDQCPGFDLDAVRRQLQRRHPSLPVLGFDAREREQVTALVQALGLHGPQPPGDGRGPHGGSAQWGACTP